MKRAFLILVMLPILAVASPAFVPTKQNCQVLYQDVVILMSYVAPCDEDLVDPIIMTEYTQATNVIDEHLAMCHEKFSSDDQDVMMDELLKQIEPTLKSWQNQIVANKPTFCQAQKANVIQRLNHYL